MPQGRRDKGKGRLDREVGELIEVMRSSRVPVRRDAGGRLSELAALIERYNAVINLISRKDIERLVSYHFFDSASLLPMILPGRRMRVLDVGGSNGLPGLVISSICPDLEVLVRDGRSKRAGFLGEACAIAGPGNAYEIGRVDDREFVERNQESFDLILARAVTRFRLLLKWCMPLLKPGGGLVAYKGSRCSQETAAARKYFFAGGGYVLGVLHSPLKERYNPLRKFALAIKSN